jgi:hypothetical protein
MARVRCRTVACKQSAGDLSQSSQRGGQQWCGLGPFTEGEACGGMCLDGIGLLAAEQGGAIVLVALRIAAGDGDVGMGQGMGLLIGSGAELLEEVQEIVGVLSGGIKADVEGDDVVSLGDAFESLTQLGVAAGGLGERQLVGGGLEVVAEEDGVMSIA